MAVPGPAAEAHPLLKRVITPFYIVRIIVLSIWIGSLALALAWVEQQRDEALALELEYGTRAAFAITLTLVVFLVITACCWVLDVVTVYKRVRRTLSHRFFLVVNVVQTAVWTGMFVLMMLGSRTTAQFIVGVVIYISFVGVLIYASIAFHKVRTASRYKTIAGEGGAGPGYVGGAPPQYRPQSDQEMADLRFESYRPYQGSEGIRDVEAGGVQKPGAAVGGGLSSGGQ